MKRGAAAVLTCVSLLLLGSCVRVETGAELSGDRQDIKSVDIYDIANRYYEGDVSGLREENAPVFTVPVDTRDEFLDDLAELKFDKEVCLLPVPMDGGYDYSGYVIIISYADDSYDLIASGGQFSYSPGQDGRETYRYGYADYCGQEPWDDFIEKYTGSGEGSSDGAA